MSVIVDIILIGFIVLGVLAGLKRGLIRSAVSIVGLFAVIILSFSFRVPLANWLIDKMPFFNFGGDLLGLTTINILIYHILSFVVVFVVLYCILNVILSITKFIDTLLKLTVIWIIPSKIGGAILGFLESIAYLYIILFILTSFNVTNNFIKDSTVSNLILDHTPVLKTYMGGVKDATRNTYNAINDYLKNKDMSAKDVNIMILQYEVEGGLISKEKVNELIETGKLRNLDGVQLAKKDNEWLKI